MIPGPPLHCIVAAAGAILAATVVAAPLGSEGAEGAKATPAPAGWPMFRGNPALTGVAAGVLPDKLSLLWTFKTGGAGESSPALAGGRGFLGSRGNLVYAP